MGEEFFYVRGLNPGRMIGAGLTPIPFPRSTRIEFDVFERPMGLDGDTTPGNARYAR
jgi:hypothetical protein